MIKDNLLTIWFQQIRAPFLILSIVLVLLGISLAHHDGYRNWVQSLLLVIGVILAHISVDLFNELSDYRTKIDESTVRTQFSGGSGMMQAGKTSEAAVTAAAYGTLASAAAIGFYFCFVTGWVIALFMAIGGLAIRFYTSHFARWLLGESLAGLTLGTLVVLGVYYALTGHLTVEVVFMSIPPGILTSLLLFLNEFPDVEADKMGGRHHLVIHFGRKKSAGIYVFGLIGMYIIILIAPFSSDVPYTALIALMTVPLAVKASLIVLKHYNETENLTPALGMNVGIVVLTDLLLAIGHFL